MGKGHSRGDGSLFYHRLKREGGVKGDMGGSGWSREISPKSAFTQNCSVNVTRPLLLFYSECVVLMRRKRKDTHLYVLTLCIVASGKPSIPQTTRLLFTLQPRSHTCLHLPACFTSTTPSVTRVFLLVAIRMGRRRTSSICTLLCPFGRRRLSHAVSK